MKTLRAFTLMELLVTVAVIAILAAIALPNFLEAQTRSKIARTRADMRAVATALEVYLLDYNKYPHCNNNITAARRPDSNGIIPPDELPVLERVSTPIAYISNALVADPFKPKVRTHDHDAANPQGNAFAIENTNVGIAGGYNVHWLLKYGSIDPAPDQETGFANNTAGEVPRAWVLCSGGPDRNYPGMGTMMKRSQPTSVPCAQIYDPTNGTDSFGDIYRVNPAGISSDGFAGRFMQLVLAQN